MKKTIIYENLGFGKYPDAEIRIEKYYTDSNDYEYTDVVVNGEWWSHDLSTVDAVEKAFDDDPETAVWLLQDLTKGTISKYRFLDGDKYDF